MIKLGATFQLYYVVPILGSIPFSLQRLANIICGSALSADGTGEKMRIHLANTIDVWRDFGALETGARECATPLIRGEEARIRTNFGINIHAGKAV